MFPGLYWLVGSYLVGSIPFGLLLGFAVRGIDIRKFGSGNIGATNAGRVLGGRWGLVALILDFLKGIGPVLLVGWVLSDDHNRVHWMSLCSLATVIGHIYPIYLGFRGGKGVATGLGVAFGLNPWGGLPAAVVFLIVFSLYRFVSLASITACVIFAVSPFFLYSPPLSEAHWSITSICLLLAALVIWRHRSNIRRLWNGTEPRYMIRELGQDSGKVDAPKF